LSLDSMFIIAAIRLLAHVRSPALGILRASLRFAERSF
jgi:hypothetical protein